MTAPHSIQRNAYRRILRAAEAGRGVRLSAEEIAYMSLDDAIETAANFIEDAGAKEEVEE